MIPDLNENETLAPAETTEPQEPALPFERLKKMFRLAMDASAENDLLCIRDREYYDGDQLSANVRDALNRRGQPLFYTNRIERAVNGIFGIIDAGESDPQAYPRTSAARDAADVATKTLRFIADKANFKQTRKQLSESFVIQGTCAAIVEYTDSPRPGAIGDISIKHIRWEDFFADPHSREHDFADATYMGIAKWMDAESVKATFPDKFAEFGSPFDQEGGGIFDSKGSLDTANKIWSDPDRRRLRVVDMYYRDCYGAWHRAIFCQRGLFWFGPSEYRDDAGRTICPIEAVSYEVKQNGDRYGYVRNMIPLQDGINSRNSKLLHLVNHRQVKLVDQSGASNKSVAKTEAAKADGAIPFGWEVLPAPDLAQGQMLILQQTQAELDRMAPTPAVLGRSGSASESGRARAMLLQAGLTELVRGLGRLEGLDTRLYRQAWFRARQFFTDEMEVRITSDARAPEFIKINTPVLGPVPVPVMGPDGQPIINPVTGLPVMDVKIGQVGTQNSVAEMDVDIEVSSVPDQTTLKHEAWEKMLEFAASIQLHPFDPKFWALLKVSPITNGREMADELKAAAEEAAQQDAAAQQAQAAAIQQAQQTELGAAQAKAMRDAASARKANAEAERVHLETEALSAIQNMPQHGLIPPTVGPLQPLQ
ncbi:MAG TPA: hypothetical protein VGW40_05750 [Allosphingosinicella sp.]|nr:hypothetical protein [Allosphingosinicella sp.]